MKEFPKVFLEEIYKQIQKNFPNELNECPEDLSNKLRKHLEELIKNGFVGFRLTVSCVALIII